MTDHNTNKTTPTPNESGVKPATQDEKSVNAQAREAADTAKQRANAATQEGKQQAKGMAADAKAAVNKRAEETRSHVADESDKAAGAFHDAAREMDDDSIQARLMDQIADGISGATDQLRSKDMSSALDDLNHMARRHPVAFLSSAALLGFAATRFLKASDRSHGRNDDGGFA